MKIPEFIPFHFDKFNSNLFKRQGAEGIGRWCMIRKAVAEMPALFIDLNDASDREALELDTDSTPQQLTDMLDLAAQRGMIDADLYAVGILWIENLDKDLGRFFTTGKRNLPKRPTLQGKISRSHPDLQEKFHEVTETSIENSDNSPRLSGIPTHETKRNETIQDETKRTNEQAHANLQNEIQAWATVYGSIGNRYKTETAYIEALGMLKAEGWMEKQAIEMLKIAASKDRTFCIATRRKRKDPHTWLNSRDWVRDYEQELKDHNSQENTAKGGRTNGKSDTETIIEFNKHTNI